MPLRELERAWKLCPEKFAHNAILGATSIDVLIGRRRCGRPIFSDVGLSMRGSGQPSMAGRSQHFLVQTCGTVSVLPRQSSVVVMVRPVMVVVAPVMMMTGTEVMVMTAIMMVVTRTEMVVTAMVVMVVLHQVDGASIACECRPTPDRDRGRGRRTRNPQGRRERQRGHQRLDTHFHPPARLTRMVTSQRET